MGEIFCLQKKAKKLATMNTKARFQCVKEEAERSGVSVGGL
jgi:hypothetical protein